MKSRFALFSAILIMTAAMAAAQTSTVSGSASLPASADNGGCTQSMQADGLCTGQSQTLDQNLLTPSATGQEGQIPGYINPLSSPYGQSLSSQLQQSGTQQFQQNG